jgi:hypothetical protein
VSQPLEAARQALADAAHPELWQAIEPVLRLRLSGLRLIAVLPNRIWLDAFRVGLQAEAERVAAARGLVLQAMARDDQATQNRRGLDGFAEDPGNALALAACRRALREPARPAPGRRISSPA